MKIKPTSTSPLNRTLGSCREPTCSTNTGFCATKVKCFLSAPIKSGYFCTFCFAFIVTDCEDTTGSILLALPKHCPSYSCIVVCIVGVRLLFFPSKSIFQYTCCFTGFCWWWHVLELFTPKDTLCNVSRVKNHTGLKQKIIIIKKITYCKQKRLNQWVI